MSRTEQKASLPPQIMIISAPTVGELSAIMTASLSRDLARIVTLVNEEGPKKSSDYEVIDPRSAKRVINEINGLPPSATLVGYILIHNSSKV